MASTPTRTDPTRNEATASEADKPDDLGDLKPVSWKGVLRRSIEEFRNDNLSDWAAALTYHGVLALAPAALVLVAVIGLLSDSATETLLDNIGQIAPGSVRDVLENIITTAQDRGAAGAAAIIGLLAAGGRHRATSPLSCVRPTPSTRSARGGRRGRPSRSGCSSRSPWWCSSR